MIKLTLGSDQFNLYDEFYSYYVWKDNHCVFGKTYTNGCWVTKRKRLIVDLANKKRQAIDMAVKVTGMALTEIQQLVEIINREGRIIEISPKCVSFYIDGEMWGFNLGDDKLNSVSRSLLIKRDIIKDSLEPSPEYLKWEGAHHKSLSDIKLPARKAIFESGAVGAEVATMAYEARKIPANQGKAYKKKLRKEEKERAEEEAAATAEAMELVMESPAENQVTLTVRDAAQQADFKKRLAVNYGLQCCVSGDPLIACEAAQLIAVF